MSRAAQYANQLEQINHEGIAFTEGLSDDVWQVLVPEDQRRVGVLIQHIAGGYTAEIGLIKAVLSGEPLAAWYESEDALNDVKARSAARRAGDTKETAITRLLREGG